METHKSQKFITYYEDGEIQGFTEKIGISMNELDLTRSFLETIKEKIANCKETPSIMGKPGSGIYMADEQYC